MLRAVEKDNVKPFIDGYFNVLGARGYVKRDAVKRFMVWLFFVDFVERVYSLLDNDDYNKINDLLIRLFSKHFCLLPYSPDDKRFSIGGAVYQHEFSLRATEARMLRLTEKGSLRSTEN